MLIRIVFQFNAFKIDRTTSSCKFRAPRIILWGAFLMTILVMHVYHQIFILAIPEKILFKRAFVLRADTLPKNQHCLYS